METIEDMKFSLQLLFEQDADVINGNILLYLVGSSIWNHAVRNDKIKPDQYIISASDAGLTPYSYDELVELCKQCTDLSKKEWRQIFKKVALRNEFRLIASVEKKYIRHYRHVRKVRKALSGYGYGKKGYTWSS